MDVLPSIILCCLLGRALGFFQNSADEAFQGFLARDFLRRAASGDKNIRGWDTGDVLKMAR
jgi:hypothetical protein